MRKIFLPLFLLFAQVAFCQDATGYFNKANEKLLEENYKEALSLFDKAIQLNPTEIDYYLGRSTANIALEKIEEGFNDINKGISVDRTSVKGYMRRASFYGLIREFDKSVLDYSTALEYATNDSTKISCLVFRSGSRLGKMDHSGAVKDCKEALLIDSLNIGALTNLAIAMDFAGNQEEVLGILKKIITIDPKISHSYMNVGFKLSLMGRYSEAMEYFNKSIEMEPDSPYAYSNRSYARLMLKDADGAMKDISKSLKLDPFNSYAYRNRGLIYKEQGKIKKACEDWNEAVRLGFSQSYGKEVEELIKNNCFNQ